MHGRAPVCNGCAAGRETPQPAPARPCAVGTREAKRSLTSPGSPPIRALLPSMVQSFPCPCPDGGIGRRTSFRCWRSQGRGGSSPLLGTICCSRMLADTRQTLANLPKTPPIWSRAFADIRVQPVGKWGPFGGLGAIKRQVAPGGVDGNASLPVSPDALSGQYRRHRHRAIAQGLRHCRASHLPVVDIQPGGQVRIGRQRAAPPARPVCASAIASTCGRVTLFSA